MVDEWAYWRAMLKWRYDPNARFPQPDFDPKRPESGFYRMKQAAVAIWRTTDGGVVCLVTNPDGKWSKWEREDSISDSVFSYCCRAAISADAYKAFMATKRWPDDIDPPKAKINGTQLPDKTGGKIPVNSPEFSPESNKAGTERVESGTAEPIQSRVDSTSLPPGLGDNLPKAPDKALDAELTDLIERAEAFYKTTGGKIDTQEIADKMVNYGVAIADLEKKADLAREAEKRPYLETERAIEAKWRTVLQKADAAKKRFKNYVLPWFQMQRDKAQAEAAAAEAARRKEAAERQAAISAGMAPPPPPPLPRAEPSRTVAGTTGKASLRSRIVYEVVDLKAACAHLAALESPPDELIEVVRKVSGQRIKLGYPVPGVEARKEESVA